MKYLCPKCYGELKPSDVKGYEFVCYECDENFYKVEAIEKPETIRVAVNWDTDGEKVGLPEVVVIPKDTKDIADYLSDEYGWCVNSYFIEDEIIIPVYYGFDDNGEPVIDEDSIRKEFEQKLKELYA